jgi:hypothetical protein
MLSVLTGKTLDFFDMSRPDLAVSILHKKEFWRLIMPNRNWLPMFGIITRCLMFYP